MYVNDRVFDDIFRPLVDDELVSGLYLYLMRLNSPTLKRVEEWLQEIIPCDLDPRRTISLPIRASDKCRGDFRLDSGFGVRLRMYMCVFCLCGVRERREREREQQQSKGSFAAAVAAAAAAKK
jgi:hypothetical protein